MKFNLLLMVIWVMGVVGSAGSQANESIIQTAISCGDPAKWKLEWCDTVATRVPNNYNIVGIIPPSTMNCRPGTYGHNIYSIYATDKCYGVFTVFIKRFGFAR